MRFPAVCEICKIQYDCGKASRVGKSRFCSRKCGGVWHATVRLAKRWEEVSGPGRDIECLVCGKKRHVHPGNRAARFCSQKCWKLSISSRKSLRAPVAASPVKKRKVRPKSICIDCGKERRMQSVPCIRCRACSLKNRFGPSNPNWKGGVKKEGAKIRSSPEYAQWRLAVFSRDGFRCVACGADGDLHADHIKPFAYFPELRLSVQNGRTLCPQCHSLTDTYMAKVFSWRRNNGNAIKQGN